MSEVYVVNDFTSKQDVYGVISAKQCAGKTFAVQIIEDAEEARSLTQNAALHVWFRHIAKALNDSGMDKREFFKEPFFFNWQEDDIKDMYKMIMEALGYGKSTATIEKPQMQDCNDHFIRKLAEHGISVPFPSRT